MGEIKWGKPNVYRDIDEEGDRNNDCEEPKDYKDIYGKRDQT